MIHKCTGGSFHPKILHQNGTCQAANTIIEDNFMADANDINKI